MDKTPKFTEEQKQEVINFLKSDEFKKYVQAELRVIDGLFKPGKRYKSNPITQLKEQGLWDTPKMYDTMLSIYKFTVFGDKSAKLELSSTLRQSLSEICTQAIDKYLKDTKQK